VRLLPVVMGTTKAPVSNSPTKFFLDHRLLLLLGSGQGRVDPRQPVAGQREVVAGEGGGHWGGSGRGIQWVARKI